LVKFAPDLFQGVGCFPGEVDLAVDESIKLVASPSARLPEALKPKVRQLINDLEQQGFISKCTQPPKWVSRLLIRDKSDDELRPCLDPRPLNSALIRQYYEIPKKISSC